MKCLTFAALGLSLLLPTAAIAQVKISVPAQHYRTQGEIHGKVENTGSRPVTYGIEKKNSIIAGLFLTSAPRALESPSAAVSRSRREPNSPLEAPMRCRSHAKDKSASDSPQ